MAMSMSRRMSPNPVAGGETNPTPGATEKVEVDPLVQHKQSELNAQFGSVRLAGRDAERQRLFKLFNVNTEEELQKKLDEAERLRKEKLSDEDRLKAENDQALKEAAEAKAETARIKAETFTLLMRADVIAEAAAQGFADPSDAWAFVDRSKIEAKDDGTFTGVKAAVTKVGEQKPHLKSTQSQRTRPSGTPLPTPPGGENLTTPPAEATEEAKNRLRSSGQYAPI